MTDPKYPGVYLKRQGGWFVLEAQNARLADVFRAVSDATGIKVSVDANLAETRVNLDLSARTAEDLIEALSESKAFVYERDGSGYKLAAATVAGSEQAVDSPLPEGLRPPLDEKMSEEEAARLRARGVLLNTDKSMRAMLRPESKVLLLQNACIDTDRARRMRKSVDVPVAWKAPASSRFFIVQFDHPVSAADRELLEKAGATISHYVPHQALAVYADPSTIEKLREENEDIRFVEPFHPYYKVSPEIIAYFSGAAPENIAQEIDRGLFNILTRDQVGIEVALKSVGAQVIQYQEAGGAVVLTVDVPPAKIKELAREDAVQWIETAKPRKPMNDLARKFVKAPTFRALHPSLSGAGVIVAVTDTGVDYVNPGFAIDPSLPTSTNTNTRIIHYAYRPGGPTSDGVPGDNDGHGTHVSGSILGNGALSETVVKAPGSGSAPFASNQFAGVAPRARLVMIEDFNSFSDTEQAEIAYTRGARISNNSWGNSYYAYGTYSVIWDARVRDAVGSMPGRQELIAFFAAGNDGNGKDDGTEGQPGTVGEPGNAKNVITVGALEQPRWADNLLNINWVSGTNIVRVQNSDKETDSDWQVAYFSSRGPVNTGDPRIKPDIVAPGSYVLSIQSRETNPDDLEQGPLPHRDYRYGNVDSGTNYAFFSGTSMATPIGAGAAALIFEYFTNTFGREPSPAMMKAIMVAGARMCNTMLYRHAPYGAIPEVVDQGWGALDLVRSVDGPRLRSGTSGVILHDQNETSGLNTDQIYTAPPLSLTADDGGLKVVLVWSDVPGNPGNALQLVNNLDLVVYGPNGLVYQGNVFDWNGVSSYALDRYYAALGDAYNNVEVVTIPDGAPGTYTIQVRGAQVPNGPQDFALAMVKGIGREGRIAGEQPAVALTTNGTVVLAYSSADANTNRQIYVRQWVGSLDDPGRLGLWTRMDDAWFGLRGSASGQGISRSFERSVDPTVAVEGTNVYVAWVEMPRPPVTVSRIFLKQFNGRDWIELNNSGRGVGISGTSSFDALDPVVRVGWNKRPIVAFERKFSDIAGERIFVVRWNGTNWVGLAGSDTNGLPAGSGYSLVDGIAMETDASGYPIVAWGNGIGQIEVRRWTGSAWTNIGPIGFSPYAAQPSLAVSANGQIFIAWIQTASSYLAPYTMQQVFLARHQSGSNWVALGSSLTHPGVSASTNLTPMTPSVAVGPAGSVHVAWRGVAGSNTAIYVKRFSGTTATWVWAGDADEQYGIARESGIASWPAAVVDHLGIPTVAFQLGYQHSISYTNEVMVYTLVSDRDPPLFAGLGSARGGTNNNVFLQWEPASDAISTSIIYRVYRSTQTWACGVQPNCSAADVFSNLIATVTNVTSFTVTGLVSNRVYCFGVRAADTNGMMEMNTVMRSAGPVTGAGDNDSDCLNNATEIAAGTEPCVWDTDGDRMPDGWEWFYSTNNPLHTNSLAMDPLDNGFDKVRTAPQGDGDPTQAPDYDLDGDGASNYEEYQWYAAYTSLCVTATTNWISPNPTHPDTDGDGMPDGWEILNGFNPIHPGDAAGDADGDGLSNLNEYLFKTDPRMTDSDGDGLNDGAEVGLGLDPGLADTDQDGLDDAFESALGSNPRRGDTGNRQLSDGDAFQLGWSASSAAPVFNILLVETFETSSRTNWTHRAVNAFLPVNLWHLSTADPDPNLSGIQYTYQRSTNTSYRYSKGTNFENQVANDYSGFGAMQAALDSPRVNATNTATLFVSWNEYYSTEPNGDFVQVLARGGANTNWVVVTPAMSGKSGVSEASADQPARWTHRTADISQFAGQTNVQVRFLFKANGVNNEFPGWYVDDVVVYEGVRISGWVRDINGAPVQGATVRAMGRGGVTNIVGGHRIVLPAKVFGEAKTAADGSYQIRGLPQGRYYVQASAPGYIGEFFNGPLFAGAYGFGAQLNAGVYDRFAVGPAGYLVLTNSGAAYTNAHFELEKGRGRTFLGVIMQVGTNRYPVNISGVGTDYLARVWNAVTNPGTAAFQAYLTATNAALPLNRPDWLTNAVIPNLLGDLDVGNHEIIPPTNFSWITPIETTLSEGDATWVNIGTNHPQGWVKVTAGDGGVYRIWVDYRATTNFTPSTIKLPAGTHTILLAPTNVPRIAPLRVDVPRGARVEAAFDANSLTSTPGRLLVRTSDLRGNAITGATILVNGQRLSLATPALLTDLLPGSHRITVRKEGYRPAEVRSVVINSGASNEIMFALADADEDYDLVGDNVEIAGYTNIFLYHRNHDPDADGLRNLFEYEQFRLYNIFLNPFDADTDRDRMSDGAEVSYDGVTNILGFSVLETNVVQGSPTVRVRFVGRYLEGLCNFGTAGPRAVSIQGDRFVAGSITFPTLAVPSVNQAVILFGGISTTGVHQSVSQGHNKDAVVYSDSLPDRVDTDGDGMWDGFEALFGLTTSAKLDPIEAGLGNEDPDFDGLDNYREFLGPDFTANTNDWTSPISSDTDGDGIPDGWEYFYGFNPNDQADAFADPDNDGLVNLSEYYAGTNPKLADTDADFLPDFEEVAIYMSNPLGPDTDNDGLIDGREVWDRDLDGIFDGGFFPNWNGGDMDGDGYMDGPTDWDTDGDGMPDGFEVLDEFGRLRNDPRLNPANPNDADDDPDGDGLTNLQEYLVRDTLFGNNPSGVIWDYSTDPFKSDSDGDGMPDGWETYHGLHPMDPVPTGTNTTAERYALLGRGGDPDSDGLWNYREYAIRFHYDPSANSNAIHSLSADPWNPDTDEDGLTDGQEDRAFLSHAVLQDSDGDRLMDGVRVPQRMGEVESSLRRSEYKVEPTTGVWTVLAELAKVPHPQYPEILGHLVVINDLDENALVAGLLGSLTNVAIGATNRPSWLHWVNKEAWLGYANWAPSEPMTNRGYVGMVDSNGAWMARDATHVFNGYVIEWDYVPVVTNHFDRALNDVWLLKWSDDLPHWGRANVSTNYPWPPARWGHAATYIPVFETKRPRDDRGNLTPDTRILLDNRQMVVFGGRDGVTTHKDVWELRVYSNWWVWSQAPMNSQFPLLMDGLAEFQAFTILDYKNTGCVKNDSPWWDADGFGLPKNRPWSNSRSFDWTYIFGGWDDGHRYYETHLYYKSTDDPRPITESKGVSKAVTEFYLWSPGGGNNRFASALNNGRRFIIGGAGQLFNPDTKPEPQSNYVASGYSAVNIGGFVFRDDCDTIEIGTLTLRVTDAPAAPFTVSVFAEVYAELGSSLDDYSSDPDEWEPYVRHTSPLYYRSMTTNFTVPATTGPFSIDVTPLAQDIVRNAPNWNGANIGFVFYTTNASYAVINIGASSITVTYKPKYKVAAYWNSPSRISKVFTTRALGSRKGAATAYDYKRKVSLVFGGMDGNEVLGDTHEGFYRFSKPPSFEPRGILYIQVLTEKSPPPRWGANLIYDPYKEHFVLFGGFDANHRPLNDLWIYKPQTVEESTTVDEEGNEEITTTITAPAQWVEVKEFASLDRPQPRGGASMIFWGGFDYDRAISDYCVSGNRKKIVLFGGTDGKTYFNDTWVYDYDRWILVNPVGEQSQSPWPRAFASMVWAQNADSISDPYGTAEYRRSEDPPPLRCASPVAILFGGRTGALPGGRDTDDDMVEDGAEYELGGPSQGRDPRVNRLVYGANNTNETIPYTYLRIGPRPASPSLNRGAVANFESLRHDDGIYACANGLPWEAAHPDLYSQVTVSCGDPQAGVDADRPDKTELWYHRHGGENPYDPKDVWELGRPDHSAAGPNAVPPVARSGRWCYGTNLRGTYPNNAMMELYSPLLDLSVPSPNATHTNANSYFLVFWEWVDLKDSNDVIRIDAVRPSTPADVLTRRTGVNRPVLPVLPNRSIAHNTTGEWRKMIVPLDHLGNESNVYLRFTLQTDSSGVAGGWYIDDVAIMQGWEIFGSNLPPYVLVSLYGTNINGNALATTTTDANGNYSFGFLPLGAYNLGVLNGTANINGAPGASSTLEITNITPSAVAKIQWPAVPGLTYRVDYADSSSGPTWNWQPLMTILASGSTEQHTDPSPQPGRIYRVVILGGP